MLGIFSFGRILPYMYAYTLCDLTLYVRMLGIFSVTAPYMYACTLCDRTLYVRILGIFSVLARYMYACLAFLV